MALPPEVHVMVLRHLGLSDLVRGSRVCRYLYALVRKRGFAMCDGASGVGCWL